MITSIEERRVTAVVVTMNPLEVAAIYFGLDPYAAELDADESRLVKELEIQFGDLHRRLGI